MKHRVAALALCLFAGSCAPTVVMRPLAAYYLVDAERPDTKWSHVVLREEFKDRLELALVPYARLDCEGRANQKDEILRVLRFEGIQRRADVIEIFDQGTEASGAGVVTTHIAFGVSSGGSSDTAHASAILYRWAPCQFGFVLDKSLMVMDVTSDEARAAGILEGDRLVSIDGVEVSDVPSDSTYLRVLLEKSPGDDVFAELIRPGNGKFDVRWRLVAAEPTELKYGKPVEWERPTRSAPRSRHE